MLQLCNIWLSFLNNAYLGPGGAQRCTVLPGAAQQRVWREFLGQARDFISEGSVGSCRGEVSSAFLKWGLPQWGFTILKFAMHVAYL